jgi:hypothetical protein
MDCHDLDTTTWQLMGVYKEATYFGNDAFFEQLFKHEGVCVWNDEDLYEFMSEAREGQWSEGCIQTTVMNDYGSDYLYIDLKPTYNGNMTYALYGDNYCEKEYDGMSVSVETVAASMGLLYGKYLRQWNDALEVYKVCQPCRAYNLQYSKSSSGYSAYSSSTKSYYYGSNRRSYSSYGSYGNGRRLENDDGDDDSYDPNEGYFTCEDDADYTNVNQCMKFRTHANLEIASFEDLVTATNQKGILQINVSGTIFGSERITREQEAYVDNLRREDVAQQRAEATAAKEAVKLSVKKKTKSFKFMVAGACALGFSVMVTLKQLISTASESSNVGLSEPLYNEEAVVV